MSGTPARPIPDAADSLMAPFWAAARKRVLVVQTCNVCGETRFPPLPICSNCWSADQRWQEVDHTGSVWSYVVYHRALHPAFVDEVPYAIGRVQIEAGPIFTVRLDIPLSDIEVGMRVQASFYDLSDEITLLQFAKLGEHDVSI